MTGPETRTALQWLDLAVGVLILAGVFALLLVVARMPPFDGWVGDPLFFRRCLVVHVNLALVAWFTAFLAGFGALLPAPGRSAPWTRLAPAVSAGGIALLGLAALAPGAEPVLSNYVPMIDHPLFAAGHLIYGAGVLLSFADRRLLDDAPPSQLRVDASVVPGIKAIGVALSLAALTFLASWLNRPVGVDTAIYYDLLHWGGGHVLQLASVAGMLVAWLVLLGSWLGRPVIKRPVVAVLFALLLGPWLLAPPLAMLGTQNVASHAGFTSLMRFGLFPVVLAVLAICGIAVRGALRSGEIDREDLLDGRFIGFAVSAGLTVLGFALGFLIRGSTTMIPAHYHASIGAVTAAFMATTWVLLGAAGHPVPARLRRWAAAQPPLFAVGQAVFAVGFAVAGASGAERKVYGAEQGARGLVESLGLGVMGVGGLVAAAGGLLFLALALACRVKPSLETTGGLHAARGNRASRATIDGQPLAAPGAGYRRSNPVVHDLGLDRADAPHTSRAAVMEAK